MSDNSRGLKRARRQDSNVKRRRANETLQAMIDAGESITFPAVARRAGVSVSLLYADTELANRLSEARHLQRAAGDDRAWRLPTRSLVTEQSLRADLANAKDQVRRLSEEVALLRDRLARGFGAETDRSSGRTMSPLFEQFEEQVATLETDNAQLREHICELEGTLQESTQTLEAARAMNRDLMTQINIPVPRDARSAAATPRSTTSRGSDLRNR